ncbi:2-keto-4-pentenoate hydratase/2-oxohepta-3-ene-1,7-dioic acid hydratase in catechol pathway [Aliiruegeria haliotis]|uniref:2-keto-4-pentenoate hydratase/2-oxohepta-3-ene-1,7-dioic acid hydratase in catechol pathway n=1 Tax=Aliiruegeria haliotis TaxID=1280846 RepID=A0A2T0RIE6_9RHOB|nr:fumarylacetoacetate hydrolase family protein [Aliiruegeria haliotis]PRY20870.1 2-keto-4-pentenoate hydratase/2-oxohepta-3-ene-1,7-dioic acid hydratase in catechol pathway [Aliiruegeria haliotis]
MKLMRFGDRYGAKTPCILDADGTPRDVSSIVGDFGPRTMSPELLAKLKAADLSALPTVDTAGKRIAPPVAQPFNIWCVGLNYSDHAEEAGMAIPDEPILFNKSSATYCGPNDNLLYSPKMTKLDWEVELGIIIGKPTLGIAKEQAMDHVAGFVLVNDVSERAWQLERGGQWVKGKSFPNFCPTGPWLVSPDEFEDVQNLNLWLDVNGQRMQSGSTAKMIFDVETIVSYMSEFCQLEPGDLICTGTPPGVGAGMTPQTWLQVGDTCELGADGLGTQRQDVVALADRTQ